MARQKVIVKRLAVDRELRQHERALLRQDRHADRGGGARALGAGRGRAARARRCCCYAYLNACFETGFANPIDEAIRSHRTFDVAGYRKLDEVPYDFVRKRLSILVADGDRRT